MVIMCEALGSIPSTKYSMHLPLGLCGFQYQIYSSLIHCFPVMCVSPFWYQMHSCVIHCSPVMCIPPLVAFRTHSLCIILVSDYISVQVSLSIFCYKFAELFEFLGLFILWGFSCHFFNPFPALS